MTTEKIEIGDDLKITRKIPGLCGGYWILGSLNGHQFQALVFEEHADNKDHELGDSRISKLWVKRISDGVVVVNYDRGWDKLPTDYTAQAIAEFLTMGLSDYVFAQDDKES